MTLNSILCSLFAIVAACNAVNAQSSPGLRQGQVPTAAQWNSYFAAKQDYLGFAPLSPNNIVGSTPITVSQGGGVLTIACPTCAGGAAFVANPTALVGLTPVNGIAATAIRSDGAPALDQSIAPTWTQTHTFSASPIIPTPTVGDNSTKAASTAFVQTAVGSVSGGSGIGVSITNPTYGATCSGGAGPDNATAIQNAMNAVPSGGTLFIPACPTGQVYVVTGSGTTIFNRTTPINILGEGLGSIIFPTASVPNTRDVFTFAPAAPGNGYSLRNFSILPSASGSRHAIHFNVPLGSYAFQVQISGMLVSVTAGGNSIKLTNDPSTTSGGIAYSQIGPNNNLESVSLGLVGDGVSVLNNILSAVGTNAALRASFVTGAGGFVAAQNVITALNGHVLIDNGVAPIIGPNELETPNAVANTYGFLVDLGITGTLQAPQLIGNSYAVLASTGNPIPIRVRGNVNNARIADARSSVQTGGTHIQVDASAADTSIDRTTQYLVNNAVTTPVVTDAGTRTGSVEYFADGSAAAPSMAFLADKTTGFYRVTTGIIGFSTSGTVRAILSSTFFTLSGGTGIGFNGSSSGTASIVAQAAAGTPVLTLPNTTGTFAVGASSPLSLSATTGALTCSTCAVTSGTLAQFAATTSAQLAGVIPDETGTGSLVFATSPTFVTQIATPLVAASSTDITIQAATTSNNVIFTGGGTRFASFYLRSGIAAMSIGTTTQVTAGATGFQLAAAPSGGGLSFDASPVNTAGTPFSFNAGNTSAGGSNISGGDIFLLSGQSTGTGTSSIWMFAVPGTAATTTLNSIVLAGKFSANASGGLLTVDQFTATNATVTLSGLATDATHTDRTVCQDTTSKALFFGSGAAGICLGTSSERFKHDVVDLSVGLDAILALRTVSYRYNADYGDPTKDLYGFVAEQVQPVLPQLVGLDTQGRPNSVDWAGLVPVTVRAIQQLEAHVRTLRADNDNLREQLTTLAGR